MSSGVRPRLGIHPMRPDAVVPRYATEGAAGLDLHAAIEAPLTLGIGRSRLIPTGLRIVLPPGHEGQVRPRSGLALRHGVTVLNAPGTIDEDYRGELHVLLVNLGPEDVSILPKDRIAQLVVAPVARVAVEIVPAEALTSTDRGVGGFGSTGR